MHPYLTVIGTGMVLREAWSSLEVFGCWGGKGITTKFYPECPNGVHRDYALSSSKFGMTDLLNGSAISPQEVLHTLERTGQKQLPLCKPVLPLPSYVISDKFLLSGQCPHLSWENNSLLDTVRCFKGSR